MVAEVIINSSVKTLNKIFDYEVPNDLDVKIGTRVFVPFASKKELEEGIVVGIKEKSNYKVKKISALQEEQIDSKYIELAKWMSHRYFCNISDCLRLMLPPGRKSKNVLNRVKEKQINLISLAKEADEILNEIEQGKIKSEKQKNVLEFIINNGNVSMQDIELFTDASSNIVKTLIKNGYLLANKTKIERNPFLHKTTVKSVDLNLTDEQEIALKSIKNNEKYLLYGVTGSGKTA